MTNPSSTVSAGGLDLLSCAVLGLAEVEARACSGRSAVLLGASDWQHLSRTHPMCSWCETASKERTSQSPPQCTIYDSHRFISSLVVDIVTTARCLLAKPTRTW
jgi:hypothetical protein